MPKPATSIYKVACSVTHVSSVPCHLFRPVIPVFRKKIGSVDPVDDTVQGTRAGDPSREGGRNQGWGMRRWLLMAAFALLLLLNGGSIFTTGSHPGMPLGENSRALLEKMVELAPRLDEGYVGENESCDESESVDEYEDDDDEVPPVRPEDLPYLGEGSKVLRVPNLFRKSKRQMREEREREKAEKKAMARKAEEQRQRKEVAEMQAVADAASREEEEKRRKQEGLYFELTELLRRMAAGDQVNPEDLPAEIQGDFARYDAHTSQCHFLHMFGMAETATFKSGQL